MIQYDFTTRIWKHPGKGGWCFVSLPTEISREIRAHFKWQEEGWGRMKVSAVVREVEWQTAIWFDKKRDTYLLPLKADVRKRAGLKIGEIVAVQIRI